MGILFIILGCFVIYYVYKVWNDFQSGKSSRRSFTSTELKTRNDINRYKEIQKVKYEKRD
ncbi:hypothetical protein SAMN05443253_10655 [Bacillus sp. OK048]|nr:hypothetical protein SAMN05443253_10655 [Bacillus sp. OK048]